MSDWLQIVGKEALETLTKTVKRDFHDPETLRAALETLLVVFMYEEHPVSPPTSRKTLLTSSHPLHGYHYRNCKIHS